MDAKFLWFNWDYILGWELTVLCLAEIICWDYVLGLYPNIISWDYMKLCPEIILGLYPGIMSWDYILVLCPGMMSWDFILGLSWDCVLGFCPHFMSWDGRHASKNASMLSCQLSGHGFNYALKPLFLPGWPSLSWVPGKCSGKYRNRQAIRHIEHRVSVSLYNIQLAPNYQHD